MIEWILGHHLDNVHVVLKIRLRIEQTAFLNALKTTKVVIFERQDKYNKLEKSACISLIFFRVSHYMRMSCKTHSLEKNRGGRGEIARIYHNCSMLYTL